MTPTPTPTEKQIEAFIEALGESETVEFEYWGKEAILRALSAALAVEAGAVGVKPLEWNPYRAETPFGWYEINDQRDVPESELKGRFPFLLCGSRLDYSRHASLQAAKAAAQADYEARILSALTTSPASSGVEGEAVAAERQFLAQEARRYASHYPEASDGRNTFVIFAEMIEARSASVCCGRPIHDGDPEG